MTPPLPHHPRAAVVAHRGRDGGRAMSMWKPGDVAIAHDQDWEFRVVRHQGSPDYWSAACGVWPTGVQGELLDYRPLVVIDPEDNAAVQRLFSTIGAITSGVVAVGFLALRDALREFARPTPRIEEPQGLGAVVEDAEGHRWVRVLPDGGPAKWCRSTLEPIERFYVWSAVPAVRILSPGVEAES